MPQSSTQLETDLAVELPTIYPDWQGKPAEVKRPKGRVIARCGDVVMIQQSVKRFAVCYCLQVTAGIGYALAAVEFGQCCIHQATCAGLVKEGSK